MKKINKIIMALVAIGVITASFASCSNNTKKDEEIPSSSQTETKDVKSSQEEEVKGKYSDNEVYKNDEGTEYSKTEDGTEVELSGENFQNLMEEYEKVKGTGSEREKELLDQIQVIMDIISAKSPEETPTSNPSSTQEYPDNNSSGKNNLRIGMTKKQVENAWGAPIDIDKVHSERGVRETWWYKDNGNTVSVYFDFDGKVETIVE